MADSFDNMKKILKGFKNNQQNFTDDEVLKERKICQICGKEIDNDDHLLCKCCLSSSKEKWNRFLILLICLIILPLYILFSPIKFDIQILGMSVETKISYDFFNEEVKISIGALNFNRRNIKPIDYINMKFKIADYLLNNDRAFNIDEMIQNNQTAQKNIKQINYSSWHNRALVEYQANEERKNTFFLNNLFKPKAEKEENFYNLLKQFELSAETVENTYANANRIINEEYVRKYIIDYHNMGFDISFVECDYYFEPYYPYLIKTFGIPKVWKEYLELKVARQNDFGEAFCRLDLNDMVQVLQQYDKFLRKYPKFRYIEQVKQDQNRYLYSYLHGFDNGLIFDYETKKIKNNNKQSIEIFLEKNTNFSKYHLVKEYYNKLQRNNYKINDNISNWLSDKLF